MRILQNKYVLYVILFIGNIIFFLLCANMFNMHYEENDDIFMCLIANGNFTGSPDCHLVFQNALYGLIISSLYKLTSIVEWYTIVFVVIHILSITVIVYSVLQRFNSIPLLVVVLLSIYSIWCVTIQSFQFTTTAGLACVAGYILLLSKSQHILYVGYFAVFIASLIRFEVVVLVGLLFLPLIILIYRRDVKRYLYIIGVIAIVLIPKAIDKLFYQTVEWSNYCEYNALRGKVNDNPNVGAIDLADIESIGINKRDYVMLCDFMIDPHTITLPILKQIVNKLYDVPLSFRICNIKQLVQYRIPIILIFVVIVSLVFVTKSKFDKMILILWFFWFVTILSGLCLDHNLKNRVFLCSLLAMLVFLSFTFDKITLKPWLSIVLVVCQLGIGVKYFYQCYKTSDIKDRKYNVWYEQQNPLIKNIPSNAYLLALSELNVVSISPFDVKSFQTKIYPIGWLTAIPLINTIGSSFSDIVDSNVYILIHNEDNVAGLTNYLNSKYNKCAIPNIVAKNEQYSIIQYYDTY